ncbi:MAG TPA: FkbM family methyltransferase [Microlunatus sp.]
MSVTVQPRRGARALGMARSLITYYGPVWRRRRITAFYGQFLAPGDLAFDIGAHVGNRTRTFRRLGARVVAVEPQPDFTAVLRLLYGRDAAVALERCGVGAQPGRLELRLSTRTPTVSTFAESWIDEVQADTRFRQVRWDASVRVPLTTLDELIDRHGEPQFCKIDVEGFEPEVLRGLSRALQACSFEYIPVAVDRAVSCVERLSALGDYRFRHSRVETHRWAGRDWLERTAMIDLLTALPTTDRSGDVYAVRLDRLQKIRRAEPRSANTVSPVASSTPSLSVTR